MAYQTDYFPIEYLQRRVAYYKKRRSSTKNAIKNKILVDKYGEQETKAMIAKRLEGIDQIVRQYEMAIMILTQNIIDNV
jgi:hypothetical protein